MIVSIARHKLINSFLTGLISFVLVLSIFSFSPVGQAHAETIQPDIQIGYYSILALKDDGTMWSWGNNQYGALGLGTGTGPTVPTQISSVPAMSQISEFYDNASSLGTDGSVYTWGNNSNGELGDGTTTSHYTPEKISSLSGVTQISVGYHDELAVLADGTVEGWGNNNYGILGNGLTSGNQLTPGLVKNSDGSSFTGVKQVVLAQQYALYLKTDGTVWLTGSNFANSGLYATHPVQLSGFSNTQKLLGTNFLRGTDGNVYAFGTNSYWALGAGTSGQIFTTPKLLVQQNINQLSLGNVTTLAVLNDQSVVGWGWNPNGELGPDTTSGEKDAPVSLPSLNGAIKAVSGTGQGFLIQADGTIKDFGSNPYGSLGNGTTTNVTTPSYVITDTTTKTHFSLFASSQTGDTGGSNSASQAVTLGVVSGGLELDPLGTSINFGSVNSSAGAQTVTSQGVDFDVNDFRGTGAGWHISVQANPFTNGTHSFPAGSFTMNPPTLSENGNSPSILPQAVSSPFLVDNGSAVNVVSAAVGNGMGSYHLAFDNPNSLKLAIPAGAYSGSYTSTVNWQLVSAP